MSEPERFELEDGPELQALLAINTWHQRSCESMGKVLAEVKEGISLSFTQAEGEKGPLEVTLNDDQAYGFRMGLSLAIATFGQLPVQLDFNGSTDELPEVDFESLPPEEKKRLAEAMTEAGIPMTGADDE